MPRRRNNCFDKSLAPLLLKKRVINGFRGGSSLKISSIEISDIENKCKGLVSLFKDIMIDILIVPSSELTCNKNEDYCILFYSNKSNNYLYNIGYLAEQLCLYLNLIDVGYVCVYEHIDKMVYNGLDFVLALAIKKVGKGFYEYGHKTMKKSVDDLWCGGEYLDIGSIVCFTTGIFDTKSWFVQTYPKKFNVYGNDKLKSYNSFFKACIDIGAFLFDLEVILANENIKYERFVDNLEEGDIDGKNMIATYVLGKSKRK